jgi:hypothetical protein
MVSWGNNKLAVNQLVEENGRGVTFKKLSINKINQS